MADKKKAFRGILKLEIDELGIEATLTFTRDKQGAVWTEDKIDKLLVSKKITEGVETEVIPQACEEFGGMIEGTRSYVVAKGTAPGETLVSPYGAFFMDLLSPWIFAHFGSIPQQVPLTLPAVMPTPVTVYCQDLAIDLASGGGNTSNPVEVVIR